MKTHKISYGQVRLKTDQKLVRNRSETDQVSLSSYWWNKNHFNWSETNQSQEFLASYWTIYPGTDPILPAVQKYGNNS